MAGDAPKVGGIDFPPKDDNKPRPDLSRVDSGPIDVGSMPIHEDIVVESSPDTPKEVRTTWRSALGSMFNVHQEIIGDKPAVQPESPFKNDPTAISATWAGEGDIPLSPKVVPAAEAARDLRNNGPLPIIGGMSPLEFRNQPAGRSAVGDEPMSLMPEAEAKRKDAEQLAAYQSRRAEFEKSGSKVQSLSIPGKLEKDQAGGKFEKSLNWFKDRNETLNVQAGKLGGEKLEKMFRGAGEWYNKQNKWKKIGIGLAIGGGAALSAAGISASVPFASVAGAVFGGGVVAQRVLGGLGRFITIEKNLQKANEGNLKGWIVPKLGAYKWLAAQPEQVRSGAAVMLAAAYSLGFSAAVGETVHVAGAGIAEWLAHHWPTHSESALSTETRYVYGGNAHERILHPSRPINWEAGAHPSSQPMHVSGLKTPEVKGFHGVQPDAPKTPLDLSQAAAPKVGIDVMHPVSVGAPHDAPTFQEFDKAVGQHSTLVPPEAAAPPASGVNLDDIKVAADRDNLKLGTEHMIKGIYQQLQGKNIPLPADHESDLYKLLTANDKTIDGLVHRIALDPKHHFFEMKDGVMKESWVAEHAQMTVGKDGNVLFSTDGKVPGVAHIDDLNRVRENLGLKAHAAPSSAALAPTSDTAAATAQMHAAAEQYMAAHPAPTVPSSELPPLHNGVPNGGDVPIRPDIPGAEPAPAAVEPDLSHVGAQDQGYHSGAESAPVQPAVPAEPASIPHAAINADTVQTDPAVALEQGTAFTNPNGVAVDPAQATAYGYNYEGQKVIFVSGGGANEQGLIARMNFIQKQVALDKRFWGKTVYFDTPNAIPGDTKIPSIGQFVIDKAGKVSMKLGQPTFLDKVLGRAVTMPRPDPRLFTEKYLITPTS